MRRSHVLLALMVASMAGSAGTTRAQTNPVITAPATASGLVGVSTSVTGSASDPDGENVTLSQTNDTPFYPGSGSAGPALNPSITLTATPAAGQAGNYLIHWTAVDSNVPPGSATPLTTSLRVGPDNQTPVITAPATASGFENSAITVTASATDPDAGNVTLSQTNNTPFFPAFSTTGAIVNPALSLTGIPSFSQAGNYLIQWSAVESNAPNLGTSATTAVSISNADRNPVITAPATAQGQPFVPLSVTGSATDPDGQNVTLSQTNNAPFFPAAGSSGPALNPSLTVTGTPSGTHTGIFTVNWSAVDASVPPGNATPVTTTVVIGGPGQAPVITVAMTATGAEGAPFSITASAADVDGENVTLCVTSKPVFLVGPSCSGPVPNPALTLTGTPDFDQAGTYVINWNAVDTSGRSSAATTAVTIANTNRGPALGQPFDMTVNEGETTTQQLAATDPDGAPLTFFKVGPSPLFMFVSAAGLVTLAPGFSDAGSHTATVSVSDGVATDSKSFGIAVANVNRCPTANADGPYQGVLFAPVAFHGSGSSDPDGDALSFAWNFGDGATGAGPTTSHTYTLRGTFEVSLTVDDGVCQSSVTTTAVITDGFTALAFTAGGNSTTNLGSGKPFVCIEVEPVAGSFDIANVDLGTVKLASPGTGSVSEIFADAGKTSVGADKNGNAETEIHACFAKGDLRLLFDGLPAGPNQVAVTIGGSLLTGGTFQASLTMTVKATGGTLAASISPNPMNPSAKATFSTSRPGALKVQLFDLNGRLVRTVLYEPMAVAGYHDVTIDGRTGTGQRLSSGIYFVKFWAEHDGTETKRLTILE